MPLHTMDTNWVKISLNILDKFEKTGIKAKWLVLAMFGLMLALSRNQVEQPSKSAFECNPKFGSFNEPYFHIEWQNDFRNGCYRHFLTQTTNLGQKPNFFEAIFWQISPSMSLTYRRASNVVFSHRNPS